VNVDPVFSAYIINNKSIKIKNNKKNQLPEINCPNKNFDGIASQGRNSAINIETPVQQRNS
jgi:hypothetical protein